MASRLHMRLLPLKVTLRSTTGKLERRVVHPEEVSSSQQQEVGGAEKSTTLECSPEPEEHNEDFIEGPSMHTIQKQANASAWGNIRHQLLHAVVEGEAMAVSQLCVRCDNVQAILRCLKCGPSAFYCNNCFPVST